MKKLTKTEKAYLNRLVTAGQMPNLNRLLKMSLDELYAELGFQLLILKEVQKFTRKAK